MQRLTRYIALLLQPRAALMTGLSKRCQPGWLAFCGGAMSDRRAIGSKLRSRLSPACSEPKFSERHQNTESATQAIQKGFLAKPRVWRTPVPQKTWTKGC